MIMLKVTSNVSIPDEHLTESFVRSPGPGGQHVNKTATAVQLRYDVNQADYLGDGAMKRLKRLAGRRINTYGEIVIEARRYRSQERNREDARQRLAALLRLALEEPVKRTPTRPSRAAMRRRLDGKRKRASLKQMRTKPTEWE